MFYEIFRSPQVTCVLAKIKVLLMLEEKSRKIEIKLFPLCAISDEN